MFSFSPKYNEVLMMIITSKKVLTIPYIIKINITFQAI